MVAFYLKGPITAIADTRGDELVHPAKVFSIELGEGVRSVLVPPNIFEPHKHQLGEGDSVWITGNVHEARSGASWHIATSVRVTEKKRSK